MPPRAPVAGVSSAPIRVVLVDDHAMVRSGFRMLLDSCPDFTVVAEADSGEAAIHLLAETGQDIVVLDLSMPGIGGLETLRRLLAHHPDMRILVLSVHEDAAYARRVLKAGAHGYLAKRTAPEALLEALHVVAGGQVYLGAAISRALAPGKLDATSPEVDALSGREFAVFLKLARGLSVDRIAEQMSLSSNTVGTHLYHIKRKLGASNQSELTLIALRNGLIET